jgi:hypothetical protein
MANAITFPDPDQRSDDAPMVIVQPNEILDLYYQSNPDTKTMSTSEEDKLTVHRWLTIEAVHKGRQALLSTLPLPEWVDELKED